jgi:2-dehydro-3-deoxyglucarate aldolase
MNRFNATQELRTRLRSGGCSIGSWMQIPDASVAEIMGQAGYDWVAVDLEHGSVSVQQLPDLFRALQLGGTLPLARLAQGHPKDCKQALDAGAAGVIVPMIETAQQLSVVRDVCCWPPAGRRGVGFSRANLFGKHFDAYREEAQAPLLVAQVEHEQAVAQLDAILSVRGLDAVLVGPYDLSASMGLTAQFDHPAFSAALQKIRTLARERGVACGVHVVAPEPAVLQQRVAEGYRFIAYAIDAVFLHTSAARPAVGNGESDGTA